MSQQDDARDILSALRSEPTEVPWPGELPTADAADSVKKLYAEAHDAWVGSLLTKRGPLSKPEQDAVAKGICAALRRDGIR